MTQRLALGGALAVLVALVVAPLAMLVGQLLADPFAAAANLASAETVDAAWNTAWLAIAVTAFTVLLGVPLGFLVGRSDLPGRRLWRALCTTPYVIPPYISAIAWMNLLNPDTGLLNAALGAVGIPALNIYSLAGMTWVMGLSFTPFVMLATADALERMDASLEEQARIAGAGPWRTLFRVTLPLALPGLWTGASFVMAAAAAAFGVPYLLSKPATDPTFVLTERIYRRLETGPDQWPSALALCALLLVIGLALPAVGALLQRRRRFTTVTGKATRARPFALGRARPAALAAVGAYVAIAVVLPVTTIGVTSLMRNLGRGVTWSNLTLDRYGEVLWQRSSTVDALWHSALLGAAAATGAVVLGVLVAWLARRTAVPGRGLVANLARLPYAVPGTVLAFALILTYSQEIRLIFFEWITIGIALADTLWILGLAYMVKYLTFPVGGAEAGLRAIDVGLEESARISGASWRATMSRITLPLLRPDLVAAWFLVFIPSFSEVTMSILLAGPETQVVGTVLFQLQTYGDPPAAAVLAVIVVALVLGGNTALRVATRGRVGL